MSRGKITSKVVKSTIYNEDVLGMFSNIIGGDGSVNFEIALPKYEKMKLHCDRFIKLLSAFASTRVMSMYEVQQSSLDAYTNKLREEFDAVYTAPDVEPYRTSLTSMIENVPDDIKQAFSIAFDNAKKCDLTKTIIVTCQNLIIKKRFLENSESLSDKFLVSSTCMSFAPLPGLSSFNFRTIYINPAMSYEDRSFILMILHKMLSISHDLYEAVSAPDIDVRDFRRIVESSIGDVKKHIPRCDDAFNKILSSVDLLEGNFSEYYRDYISSNNPGIIMENFVIDVSKAPGSSPKLAGQFRKIISHYRKLASQQTQDPRLKSLFSKVDENYQELERRRAMANAENADDEGDGGDEDGEGGEGGESGEGGEGGENAGGAKTGADAGAESGKSADCSDDAKTPGSDMDVITAAFQGLIKGKSDDEANDTIDSQKHDRQRARKNGRSKAAKKKRNRH